MAAEFSLQMNEHVVDEVGSRLAAETAMAAVVAACMMVSVLSQANGSKMSKIVFFDASGRKYSNAEFCFLSSNQQRQVIPRAPKCRGHDKKARRFRRR